MEAPHDHGLTRSSRRRWWWARPGPPPAPSSCVPREGRREHGLGSRSHRIERPHREVEVDVDALLVLGFMTAAAIALAIPGPDWFIVLRSAARSRRSGMWSALGLLCGLTVHLLAAGMGVSAILVASAEIFLVVKIAGALCLGYLGVRALLSAVRRWRRPEHPVVAEPEERHGPAGASWASAFAANVLNPKAALFFVAVLPQFLERSSPVLPQLLVLGALGLVLSAAWWTAFVLAVSHFRAILRRRRALIAIDATSGVALVGIGGALLLTSGAA
jgi:threonine/homoserine/homoserine lactone efflux protein